MTPRRPAAPVRQATDLDWEGTPVRLVRSTARTRTVSAAWRDGRLQISVPARLGRTEERSWIARMVQRAGPAPRGPVPGSPHPSSPHPGAPNAPHPSSPHPSVPDADALLAWARRLSAQHFGGAADPLSVTWSARQRRRWGSCTPARRTIRLSTQLQGMPDWVVEGVLVHEIAHLLEAGHGPRFRSLVARYERYAEAIAFLAGVTHAQGRGLAGTEAGQGTSTDDAVAAPDWDGDVEDS